MSEGRALDPVSRRAFVAGAATTLAAAPWVVRAQGALSLRFRTIPDPDGWAESLRLKGDWLVFEIGDGVLSGFGEASHSNDDERCKRVAAQLFDEHYRGFALSLESLARKEQEIAALAPDFVTATAFSGLNQALYDLLAKREQVPVWRLFRGGDAPFAGLPLYTTINRALRTRSAEEYVAIAAEVHAQGFATFKCAPFEAVNNAERAVEKAAAGLATLARLREQFPDLALRVDFHERFQPQDFFAIIPELERLGLDWIEEPFAVGPSYEELRRRTRLRISGGELFWGRRRFAEITERGWCDVIMPDVKHVGGFGPLLDVLKMSAGRIEVSPHNPSGPISTAASLHAAAVYPDLVRSLEYSFQRQPTRQVTGEIVENGVLVLGDRPGWGVAPQ
ncbi:MAG TPA: enolase C-terminal domain-like protein [Gammaproteobacteria bacterium]|nr:enolase C-terminal domain-like protein [Gammaproteobacteria bacterium]